MSWKQVLMKTKTHFNAKGQEYCFWLLHRSQQYPCATVGLSTGLQIEIYEEAPRSF